jgi:hypothetical protein
MRLLIVHRRFWRVGVLIGVVSVRSDDESYALTAFRDLVGTDVNIEGSSAGLELATFGFVESGQHFQIPCCRPLTGV